MRFHDQNEAWRNATPTFSMTPRPMAEPPKFPTDENGNRITWDSMLKKSKPRLPRNSDQERTAAQVMVRRKKIVAWLRKNPGGQTKGEIVYRLKHYSDATIRNDLHMLKAAGRILSRDRKYHAAEVGE